MKRWVVWVLVLSALISGFTKAKASEASSTDFIEQASRWDGKTVLYTGELIGDAFVRGDHVWLNVADTNNAIGIWAKREVLTSITYFGRYQQTGDTLQIMGTFHRACQEHGGDMDIHADEIIILLKGHQSTQAVSYPLLVVMIVLISLDSLILIVYIKKNRTMKQH